MMQKIMSVVKRSKDSKISRTSLLKAVGMKSRELDQYLETLIESVQLVESAMARESGFGPKRIVFYSA
jgi:predicted transcriptional regulator